MTSVARPLAGPGLPDTVLDVAERAGWTFTDDENGNVYAFPVDRRVIAAFLPEGNTFDAPAGALWVIRAYGDVNEVVWEATFTEQVPGEFIAAFLTDLIKPEPLDVDRGRDDDVPAPAEALAGTI